MSFVIAIYVKEGIVMASDSRTTLSAVQTIQPKNEGETPSFWAKNQWFTRFSER